jgi:hypothetical protein
MGHICDFGGVQVIELRTRKVLYHLSHSISPVWGLFITHQLLMLELLKEQVLDHKHRHFPLVSKREKARVSRIFSAELSPTS